MVVTRLYRTGKAEADGFPIADLSELVKEKGVTVWADFTSPTADDLTTIVEELGLHQLAVEDAIHRSQRSKLDRYETHLFLVAYEVGLNLDSGQLTTSEIQAFITPHALVTVHEPDFDMSRIVERWNSEADLARHGVPFLVWGLLDEVVDSHFETVQQLDTEIEALEDALFDERPREKEVQIRSFELRKSLVQLRRVVLPMREVLNTVLRRDLMVASPAMTPYFQDIYDHVLRATEWTESLRDLVTTILETNLSLQSYRMNMIMKKVTSWAAIIAVPTAITGFFGQNIPFPGNGMAWGVWLSVGMIAAVSTVLYIGFKRRDWI